MASSSQSATSKPPGFFQDTKDLIHNYQKTANVDFVAFRRVWKEMSFSLIHHGNPKDMEREEYTQRLFATALGFLYVSQPLIVRVGVLYCLYLLHSTQLLRPKALIRVSMATWQELLQLYEEIKQHKLTSAYHVFKKMHREGYFAFVATAHVGYAPPDPALGSEALRGNVELPPELLNADTLRGVVDIDTIDYLAKLYVSTKEHVSGTVSLSRLHQ
ncbi:Small nuclear RNA activating complex, polypeptide 1, 43kDa [Balamuthia mandrillaris]